MLYITENTKYCMLRNHRCSTLADSLRYGIASNCLETTKLYECKNRNMVRKLYKNIRSHKEVKYIHRFKEKLDDTWKLTKKYEGRARTWRTKTDSLQSK